MAVTTQEFLSALQEQDKVDFIKTLIHQFAPSMSAADAAKLANISVSSPVNLNTMLTDIAAKVDKVTGKGLSQEDFTTVLKDKLATMEGSHFKGVHASLAALETAHPAASSEAGSYAYVKVGNDPETMAMLDAGAWVELTAGSSGSAMTASQVKALYESNPETNALTDAEKAKLGLLVVSTGINLDECILEGDRATSSDLQDPNPGQEELKRFVDNAGLRSVVTANNTHQDGLYVAKVTGKDLSSNDYTDAEKLKLSTLEGSHFKGTHTDEAALVLAHPTAEPGSYAYVMDAHNHEQMYVWDDANTVWENLGHTSAAHLTDAQIKTQYENNPDTNVFDDASVTLLSSRGDYKSDGSVKMDSAYIPTVDGDLVTVKMFKRIEDPVIKTVGVGKDFTTLDEAINWSQIDPHSKNIILELTDSNYTLGDSGINADGYCYDITNGSLSIRNMTFSTCNVLIHASAKGVNAIIFHIDVAGFLNIAGLNIETESNVSAMTNSDVILFTNDSISFDAVELNNCLIAGFKQVGEFQAGHFTGTTMQYNDTYSPAIFAPAQGEHVTLNNCTIVNNTKDYSVPLSEIQYDGSYISDGKAPLHFKGGTPAPPSADGEYVLTVVGGVSTWGLNSGGASVYDAYVLGSTVNADVTFSIYHKFDGLTEETRNAGVDLTDGQEYLVQPMYQSGLTDAHILDNVNMFTAKSFADQSHQTPHPDQLYGDSGNPILGSTVKAWVNAGETIAIKYDTVFGALKATIKV